MVDHTQAVATTTAERGLPAPSFGAGLRLQSLADALEFADVVVASGLAPAKMNREGVVIAIQMGAEVGLSPMQALQNIAAINGRPAIWGDAMLGLVRGSGQLAAFKEEEIGDRGKDSWGFRCTVHREGYEAASDEFTVADAKRAGLWGKQGPWTQYPQRMLRFRARGFVLRDQFGDVLKGLRSAEEAMDMPEERNVTAEGSDRPVPTPAGSRIRDRKAKVAPETQPTEATPDTAAPSEPAPEQAAAEHQGPPFKLASALAALDAALKGTPLTRGDVVGFLRAEDKLGASEGLEHIGQRVIDAIAERPSALVAAVGRWLDEQASKGE